MAQSHFSFNMGMEKAYTDSEGNMHVSAFVSDNLVDRQGGRMSEIALENMRDILNTENVPLLPEHKSTFDIGKSSPGSASIVKEGNVSRLLTDFVLDSDYPQATKLYKDVEAGTCKKQLSVGGDAVIRKVFDPVLNRSVNEMTGVATLEHVACTRASRAAVTSAGFVSAMLKSIDWAGADSEVADKMEFEKAALTDAERKKHASVTLDNNGSHSMFVQDSKLYLHPIPPGDKNAAKVAMAEMHSLHELSRQQKQTVHDKAKAVLGSEHDSTYCSYCKPDTMGVYCEAPEVPMEKEEDMAEIDDKLAEVKTAITKEFNDSMTAFKAEILAAIKPAPVVPVEKEAIVVVEVPPAQQDLKTIMKEALAELMPELSTPRPRAGALIPEGASPIQKEAFALLETALGEQKSGEKANLQGELVVLQKEFDGYKMRIEHGETLVGQEKAVASNLTDRLIGVKARLSQFRD